MSAEALFQMPTAAELGCFISMTPKSDSARDTLVSSDEDVLVEVLRESESYRAAFLQAQDALHNVVVERDRLRNQLHYLRNEDRRLRELMLREVA